MNDYYVHPNFLNFLYICHIIFIYNMLRTENMKNMSFVLSKLTNKYILAIVIFLVWLVFGDRNNFIHQYKLKQTIHSLEQEKSYYEQEYAQLDDQMKVLIEDRERYAREKFYLHRDDEVVYLVK